MKHRMLILTAVVWAVLGVCRLLPAQEDLRSRFERALQAELAISGEISEPVPVPEPVPEPEISRKAPRLSYERPAKASAADESKLRFVRYHASWCGPCRQMERSGVYDRIRDAGWTVTDRDIDAEPDPRVTTVPQLWLVDDADRLVRVWIGPHTAADVLDPAECWSTVRIRDNEGKVFSGVCLQDGWILTCAHHDSPGPFQIELPIGELSSSRHVIAQGVLEKTDAKADLCLLSWRSPPGVTLKPRSLAATADPQSIEGFPSGNPKRVTVSAKLGNWKPSDGGPEQLELRIAGISSPQYGMSGGPALTAAGELAGIQCLGQRNQVGIATVDTIRTFLQGVELDRSPAAVATLEDVPEHGLGDCLAAAFSTHCLSEISTGDEGTFGSLLNVDFDVPDSALEFAKKLVARQKAELPAAGITIDWSGDARRIDLKPGRISLTPGMQMTVAKFGLSKRCRLDAIAYKPDLSSITFELSGMLDLTVNLK